ncbi:sigma-70 family RNA polymerase sigma factor [Paenibacillus hodogayensis]|uniref:Sigma-70 family RNA polymerase sigma factor n=1 Tax=Paenibacillus hodogayensis TaxID=279208 RepID=A0ABV5W412_9BACL
MEEWTVWVGAAMQGERSAFDRLVGRFSGMAYAVAYEHLRDAHEAEDAAQEAFTEAFLHLGSLHKPEAFPGWFKTIVIRRSRRLLRQRRQEAVPFRELPEPEGASGASAADIAERREMERALRAGVAALSPNMRLAVQLFYFQGYSLREISACLGTPAPTLKKRLFDARRKLKGKLPVADFVSVIRHLYEGGTRMLHIVNGDSVADKLRQGAVKGDILVWREVYPEGPVFPDPAEPSARAVRAHDLERTLGIPAAEFIRTAEEQERILANCGQYEEVVLWFEHDLFDQTMLCYLLHWFAKHGTGDAKLNLLCIGAYPGIEPFRGLGQLSPAQLSGLSGTWQTVGQEELRLGSALWEAYAAPDPEGLQRLVTGDTSALPYAHSAFMRHLARFPSTRNGLGIVGQTTLELVRDGVRSPLELFKQAGDRLHHLGMGDLQYWHVLAKLTRGPHPLLHIAGLTAFPDYKRAVPDFGSCVVTLTEQGASVLAGEADAVTLNGIDAWYGGVHEQGCSARWRWDEQAEALALPQAEGTD